MPTFKFAEIPFTDEELDKFSNEDGLYPYGEFVNRLEFSFAEVKEVAGEICTARQYEIFLYLERGLSVKQIAVKIGTSKQNVYYHIQRLCKKIRKYYDK